MQRNHIYVVAAVIILILAGIGIALLYEDDSSEKGVVGVDVDFSGREIVPVDNFDNGIVAIGQDSFRWATYFGVADKCVMIDTNDKTNFMGKSFMYVGRALADVSENDLNDFTHTNCGITDEDVKNILNLKPSIVIVPEGFYTDYPNQVKALLAGEMNVLSIGYIYTFLDEGTFEINDRLDAQINLLSKALNLENRGNELKDAINDTVKDIRNIASKVETQKSGYIGSLAYNGAHGADSSIPYYIPFALANVKNIIPGKATFDGSGVSTYSATTIKENMQKDTIMFLDATGIYQCTDNTSKGIIQLFAGHDAYIAAPYIWTGINYESVLISAYQILMDAYGLLTEDEFEQKVNTVYDLFLGSHISNRDIPASGVIAPSPETSIYDDMSNVYLEKRGNPIHGKIMIANDGSVSFA